MIRTLIGAVFPSLIVESHLADRLYPLSSLFAYIMEEFGYMHLQATKPDTIGELSGNTLYWHIWKSLNHLRTQVAKFCKICKLEQLR